MKEPTKLNECYCIKRLWGPHCIYLCVCRPSGGRDEQEGLEAVRRICEEDKEAKGNIANMCENTRTNTTTYTQVHVCVVVFICQCVKIKGRAAAVCSSGLFLQSFSRRTHIIAHLQVYTRTDTHSASMLGLQCQAWRGGYKGKGYEEKTRGDKSSNLWERRGEKGQAWKEAEWWGRAWQMGKCRTIKEGTRKMRWRENGGAEEVMEMGGDKWYQRRDLLLHWLKLTVFCVTPMLRNWFGWPSEHHKFQHSFVTYEPHKLFFSDTNGLDSSPASRACQKMFTSGGWAYSDHEFDSFSMTSRSYTQTQKLGER